MHYNEIILFEIRTSICGHGWPYFGNVYIILLLIKSAMSRTSVKVPCLQKMNGGAIWIKLLSRMSAGGKSEKKWYQKTQALFPTTLWYQRPWHCQLFTQVSWGWGKVQNALYPPPFTPNPSTSSYTTTCSSTLDCFTISLHIPNSRLPAVRDVQGDCSQ